LSLEVFIENMGQPDSLGAVELPLAAFPPNTSVRKQYPLDSGGELEVSVNVQGAMQVLESPVKGVVPASPTKVVLRHKKVHKVMHVVVHKLLLQPASTASLYVSATLRNKGRVQRQKTPSCKATTDGSTCSVDWADETASAESAGLMWDRSKRHHLQFEAMEEDDDAGEGAQLMLELWSQHEHLKDDLVGTVQIPMKARGVQSEYYALPCGSTLHVTTYKSRPSRTSLAKLPVTKAKAAVNPATPTITEEPIHPSTPEDGGQDDEDEDDEQKASMAALIRRMSTFATGSPQAAPVARNAARAPQAPPVRLLCVHILSAQRLQNVQLFRPMDIFVECTLVGSRKERSKCTPCVEEGGTDPTFAEKNHLEFDLLGQEDARSVRIDVWNRNTVFAAQLVGSTSVQLPARWEEYMVDSTWTSLCNKSLDPCGNIKCRIWNAKI
jgi:hypothetical protein